MDLDPLTNVLKIHLHDKEHVIHDAVAVVTGARTVTARGNTLQSNKTNRTARSVYNTMLLVRKNVVSAAVVFVATRIMETTGRAPADTIGALSCTG